MRRVHRWLIAVGALIAALLLAIALLLWKIDPDSLRPAIEAQVRQRLGVSLQLTGPLHWKLWPAFAVQSGPGTLGTDEESALLRWQSLHFTLQWPGWHATAWQLEGVTMDGLQLSVQADAKGHWNLAALADAFNAAPSSGAPTRALRIHPLHLRNADLLLRTAPDAPQWRFAHVDLDADVDGSADSTQWTLADLRVAGLLSGGALPAAGEAFNVQSARVAFDLPAFAGGSGSGDSGEGDGGGSGAGNAAMQIAPLQLRLGAASLRVAADQPLHWQPLRGAGEVQFESATLREWLAMQGFTLPPTRDANVLRGASLSAHWRLDAGKTNASTHDPQLTLDALQVRLDDTHLQGQVAGRWQSLQRWQIDLQGDALNLDRYRRPNSDPGEPFRLPVEALRALPLNGSVRMQRLTVGGAVARDAVVELRSGGVGGANATNADATVRARR